MTESYKLFLNAGNSRYYDGTNYVFYVDWQSILPKKHSKYKVNFSFKRDRIQTGSVFGFFQVKVTLGSGNKTSQEDKGTDIIGIYTAGTYASGSTIEYNVADTTTYNTKTSSTVAFHETNGKDNIPITINYPTNNNITVTVIDSTINTYLTSTLLLFLTFTPIKDSIV